MGSELDLDRLEELLDALRETVPSLARYNLTLYRRVVSQAVDSASFEPCCSRINDRVSNDLAHLYFTGELDSLFEEGATTACRFGGAFLGFVVPFCHDGADFCLVGDGVRDTSIDLWQLAALSRRGGNDVFSLFPHVESLTTTTLTEVESLAKAAFREISRLSHAGRKVSQMAQSYAETAPTDGEGTGRANRGGSDRRLAELATFFERVDRSKSLVETLALLCDALQAQVSAPRVMLALREQDGSFTASGLWGLPDELGQIPAARAYAFVPRGKARVTALHDAAMRDALPALQATLVTSFALEARGERLGFLTLIDAEPDTDEALLISMLTRAVASRLSQLLKEEEQARVASLSGRLLSLTNTLLQVDSKDELYKNILEIAADLLCASQGSIMLIDKNGETMHIVYTKGISLQVAQCLPMKVGKGIAGRVAQTGQPMVVNDVEQDSRVAMINRPRFKSKALVCIPLKLKEKIIGVLNLSDKANLAPFDEADLQLLTSFANLASLMIERTLVLEESVRFEQLSVTDSLTGLYNRRFLKSRIEEELNRANHQGLSLSVLFIDLDFFKNYNDICGHLAGDEALRRTGDIILATLREMDTVARYGGEEFCALLPGTSKNEALLVAERIRAEIEAEQFPGAQSLPLGRLTASLGVASFPEDGRSYTALINASDIALYQAKARGRNQVVASHPSRQPESQQPPSTPQPSPAPSGAPAPAAGPLPSASQDAPAAHAGRTFDFNSYLEATESLRRKV